MLISGNIGVGKTSILSYVAQHVFKIGRFYGYNTNGDFVPLNWMPKYKIKYCSVAKLFDVIYKFNDEVDEYKNCDALFLDDFGVEIARDTPVSKFEDLVDYRKANRKSMFVTTNLSQKQLFNIEIYKRIMDRWCDENFMQFVIIAGESQR